MANGDYEDWYRSRMMPESQPPQKKGGALREQYKDTWRVLSDLLRSGGSPDAFYGDLLERFEGGQDLSDFLYYSAPFLASSLFNSPNYKALQNWQQFDTTENAMRYGAGAIGAQSRGALQAGQQQLSRSGLARSGAMSALEQRSRQMRGAAVGDLYGRLLQNQGMNRAALAGQALGAQQGLTQLAIGLTPRHGEQGKVDWSGIAQGGGQAIGGLFSLLQNAKKADAPVNSGGNGASNAQLVGDYASGIGSGAAAGSVFGPVGTVVGGLAGGISSWLSRRRR